MANMTKVPSSTATVSSNSKSSSNMRRAMEHEVEIGCGAFADVGHFASFIARINLNFTRAT